MGKASDLFSDKVRSVARQHRYTSKDPVDGTNAGAILPTYNSNSASTTRSNTGGLDEKDGRGLPSGPSAHGDLRSGGGGGGNSSVGGGVGGDNTQAAAEGRNEVATSSSTTPAASPAVKSEATGSGDTAVRPADGADSASGPKPPMTTRMIAGSKRFAIHTKDAVCYSWINVLLVFVPIGIAAEAAHLDPSIIFALNAIAIVPLAGLLSHATESVASRLGDTIGALLNVTFGNAVELIIFIIALVKNEIRIVQASLLGSILANLLLILGMAFLLGGLRYREQIYNSTVTQMSACLLSLSVMSLLLPTAFHASFNENSVADANKKVLAVSRGTSVVLLLVYILYLLFQLKSHAYMYESTPQEIIDEESHPGVLADMLGSSSSSDDSSSSSSSDSDSSGSGSVKTAGKRFKRMIKNRRRRKSSASTASTSAQSVPSALSSPSTTMERQGNYWDHGTNSQEPAPRPSHLDPIVDGNEQDADTETGTNNRPRVRDFGHSNRSNSKSPEPKKSKKKDKKRARKNRKQQDEDAIELSEKPPLGEEVLSVQSSNGPRVGFAEDVTASNDFAAGQPTADQSPAKRPFNMRGFSSRAPTIRPGLTKMLSNNVFSMPPPSAAPQPAPAAGVARTRSAGLRRTSSLPDRLNRQGTQLSATQPTTVVRNGPLPPYQHQQVRRTKSGNDEDSHDGEEKPTMSRTAAVVMLLVSTALVAVCAEFMVDAIPDMIESSPVSQAFIGLIILPIVGNAAEHVTAVTVATKNKMDLAIGVAVGSSIQIALFVTPIVVLLGWILETDMSLYFNLFETISLFVTAFVVNFLVLDGRSNYLEGSLLIAAYVIIALGAFFYPSSDAQSAVGGGADSGVIERMVRF